MAMTPSNQSITLSLGDKGGIMDWHITAIVVADIIGVLLVAGIVVGKDITLDVKPIRIDRSLRELCSAFWVAVVPFWFTLEERLWAPSGAEALDAFHRSQETGRFIWSFVSVLVGLVIGTRNLASDTRVPPVIPTPVTPVTPNSLATDTPADPTPPATKGSQ
jgi:hypothetical protein